MSANNQIQTNMSVSADDCLNCRKYIEMGEDKCGECGYEPSMLLRVVIRMKGIEDSAKENAIKLNASQKIDSNPKQTEIYQTTEMNTEMMNEQQTAPIVAPTPKKVRKPKVECCGCNEMFRETDIFDDAYGDHYCDECYDYEYVRCFACDEEIQRDKADEEYWERDGDNYCECCRDEYDRDEKENECDDPDKPNTYFCYDACGRILNRQMTDWCPKKVKADGMYAMALVCKSCDKKNPKNWR